MNYALKHLRWDQTHDNCQAFVIKGIKHCLLGNFKTPAQKPSVFNLAADSSLGCYFSLASRSGGCMSYCFAAVTRHLTWSSLRKRVCFDLELEEMQSILVPGSGDAWWHCAHRQEAESHEGWYWICSLPFIQPRTSTHGMALPRLTTGLPTSITLI